jgi:hypothetical protein
MIGTRDSSTSAFLRIASIILSLPILLMPSMLFIKDAIRLGYLCPMAIVHENDNMQCQLPVVASSIAG